VSKIAELRARAELTVGNPAQHGMRLFGKGSTMLAPSARECGVV